MWYVHCDILIQFSYVDFSVVFVPFKKCVFSLIIEVIHRL